MTIEKFNNTRFGAGDKIIYDGKVFDVYSVDFEEALIAINETGYEPEEDETIQLNWKRCENCELIR